MSAVTPQTLPAVIDGPRAVSGVPAGPALSAETLERVLIGGDLSKLTHAQRLEYYRARCDAAGLDPRCQPFEYLNLNGKLILYAKKTAADQLTGIHGLSVQITGRHVDPEIGIYAVDVRVIFPGGRHVDDSGAVNVAGLRGEALANATMKAVTKAKRRAVLSACGLGMLDESEVRDIPGAVVGPTAEATAPAESGRQASPPAASRQQSGPRAAEPPGYLSWSSFVEEKAEEAAEDGITREGVPVNQWMIENHMINAMVASGNIRADEAETAGKRDQTKARRLLEAKFRKGPKARRSLMAGVEKYLDELRRASNPEAPTSGYRARVLAWGVDRGYPADMRRWGCDDCISAEEQTLAWHLEARGEALPRMSVPVGADPDTWEPMGPDLIAWLDGIERKLSQEPERETALA